MFTNYTQGGAKHENTHNRLFLLCSISCSDDLQYQYPNESPSQGSGNTDPGGDQGTGDDDTVGGPLPPGPPINDSDISSISTTVTKRYLAEADSIEFTVKFSSDITITGGTPELVFKDMSDGFIHGPATYLGKISSDTMSFSYTTQLDDNAYLIDFSHIELNGASLKKSDGSDIDTDIKDGLFSSKHKIGMDTVVDLSITLNGLREQLPPPDTPNPGPGPWLINGSLYPVIEVNGRDIEGFSYKLVSSSEDCKKDGGFTTVHAKSVTLDMSKESAGPKYLCALGKVSSGFIKPLESGASEYPWYYDNTIPNIVNVTAPDGDDIYKESETITVRLEFSETVKLTNPSSLQLSFVNDLDSTVTGNAQYDSGDGTKFLNFEYLVQAGDNSSQLNVKELLLNGAEIKDLAGNSADIYISSSALQQNNTVKIDTLAPSVIDIDSLASGYYSAGEKIEIEVKFSEVVKVVGSPELVFTTDSYN